VRRLKERGLGILITDHNVRETLKLIDRGYIIHKGQVLVAGSAEFLANDPKARESISARNLIYNFLWNASHSPSDNFIRSTARRWR